MFSHILQKPRVFWDKFGEFLGIIFSPIILFLVYLITMVPINLMIRFFNIDIIQKNKSKKCQSYWIDANNKKINFKNQF